MRRPREQLSRRDLIRSFGLSALLLHPILRDMAYAAPTTFDKAPRYIHFFKGGAFYPARTNPPSLKQLAGTPIEPLAAHADDFILFKNMNTHGGSPKTTGYKEEHAAGVIGCSTGNIYHYSSNDAYFAYTDHESIDVRIANHYRARADLKDVPLASLHIGGGAHSDADNVGVGNRFISFRNRKPGDARYGNAVEPMQDTGQVYDMLMQQAMRVCAAGSNRPAAALAEMQKGRQRPGGDIDLIHSHYTQSISGLAIHPDVKHQIAAGMEQFIEMQRAAKAAAEPAAPGPAASAEQCATGPRPTGAGNNKFNLDTLSPIHDGMIAMIKLAFQLDLTRVVAFTLSGGSSGQTWPSRGIHKAHHTLEHNGDVNSLVKLDTYYAEKFAKLLESLKSIKEGDKTALYNSSVFLGMECWSNSSSGHYLKDIPYILAGQGGGRFKTGRIVDAGGRSNNDLHLSCMRAAGIETDVFGLPSLCKGPIV